MNSSIREPAVAGSFYPQNTEALEQTVRDYLHQCPCATTGQRPLAMIVPHAGYIYSAAIAASAYKQIIPYAEQISRVVLLGPSHRMPITGIASCSQSIFHTPLGDVPVDLDVIGQLNQLDYVHINDEAHRHEHSLEVQLPFLQVILKQFSIIPLLTGQVNDEQISALIAPFFQDEQTLILISSDLSHYLDYERAQQCDQATQQAIENYAAQNIHYEQACGRSAIAGLLLSAQQQHLYVKSLDLRNSGDTAGSKDRVVGYGAWAFFK